MWSQRVSSEVVSMTKVHSGPGGDEGQPSHALEKEMATHSSVLSWRIPGTGEPDAFVRILLLGQ